MYDAVVMYAHSWWHHQMETFSALLALYERNSPVNSPHKANDVELWWFFYLCTSKRLSKQSRNRWFEMPLCPLWHHCNVPRTLERILTRLSYMLQDFIFFTYLISFSILSFSFSRECKFCMGLEHSLFHFLSNQVMVTHWEMDEWGDRKPPYVGIVGTRAGGLTLTVLAFLWLCMAIQMSTSNGSWCIGIKGEMSGTVCVTFTWDIYICMSCL